MKCAMQIPHRPKMRAVRNDNGEGERRCRGGGDLASGEQRHKTRIRNANRSVERKAPLVSSPFTLVFCATIWPSTTAPQPAAIHLILPQKSLLAL